MRKAPLKSARRQNCWGRHGQASGLPTPPTAEQNQKKRTFDALPKPDNFIRYRQCYLLALLWQIGRGGFAKEFCAVGTSPGRRAHEEVKDCLPDGRQARLWRRSPDSFFSVPRP
jgi:hypothetical protein